MGQKHRDKIEWHKFVWFYHGIGRYTGTLPTVTVADGITTSTAGSRATFTVCVWVPTPPAVPSLFAAAANVDEKEHFCAIGHAQTHWPFTMEPDIKQFWVKSMQRKFTLGEHRTSGGGWQR